MSISKLILNFFNKSNNTKVENLDNHYKENTKIQKNKPIIYNYDDTLELTIPETFVYLLFANKTLEEIKRLFLNKINTYGFEYNDISFRIYKSNQGSYNLEVMMADEYGTYYKPIGYYEQNNIGSITGVYLINEFIKDFNDISYMLDNINLLKELKLIENIFIALASREVLNIVRELFNSEDYSEMNHLDITRAQYKLVLVNDLKIVVKTSIMGALEALYEDDDCLFKEDLLIIFNNNYNGLSIHCTDSEYEDLNHRELLSVFKNI
ncbi:hypothetical protein [Empedobacter falsenii]